MPNRFADPADPGARASLTPARALEMLQEGNRRFVAGEPDHRSWADEIAATVAAQFPFALVLGCIDSRVPVEAVFDQGIGDIFTVRVAGNVLNEDILGSMEFACKLSGAKAVVVLGHTGCGAVDGAINGRRLGHLSGVIAKIEPAIESVRSRMDDGDPGFADAVAETNVRTVVEQVGERSTVLSEMVRDGEIAIVGAMYEVATGAVRFM